MTGKFLTCRTARRLFILKSSALLRTSTVQNSPEGRIPPLKSCSCDPEPGSNRSIHISANDPRLTTPSTMYSPSNARMSVSRLYVAPLLAGADLGPFGATIDQAWTIINQHIGESFWSLGFTDRLRPAKYRRFQAARAVLRSAVDHVISQRRRASGDGNDLLSMLLSARDEETGEAMTDEQLRVEVTTFLLAGQETTSLALTWTWYLLSQHPNGPAATRGGDRPRASGTCAGVCRSVNLRYARMVIDESLRLYPPAWAFSRQALSDDEPSGFHLPRGWLAFIIAYVLQRLPAFWEDPDAFDPDRFLPERSAARPKFVYVPFGAGPRQCIGNHFALIEAHLIVATLAQRYRLHLVPQHKVEPWALITLRPRFGMPMVIERRTATTYSGS